MSREFSKKFYNSKAWKVCRESYIQMVNGLCERCLKKGEEVPGYIIHHKTYITPSNINNPDITLNFNNLEYVCLDCHNKEHFGEEIEVRYSFDSEGNVIPKEV